MKNLLVFLAAFFALGVGEPDPEPDPKPDPDPAPDPADDIELELPDPAPDKDDKDERPSAEEFSAAQAAEKSERERADRYERELGDLRRQRPQSPEDELQRRENAKLADEKTSELEKWQIQANRELRAGRSAANFALAQAVDVSDKTSFRAIESKKPVLFKKYEARVEEELAKVRANGGNATRESIFAYLVGKDALDDKFTRKAKPAADKTEEKKTVQRGKLPGARSDVSGKGGAMTAKQKLERKLDGVQI